MAFTKVQQELTAEMRERGVPAPFTVSDTGLNVSDKQFAVEDQFGGDAVIEVQGVRIEYVADATAGARGLSLEVKDASGDVIMSFALTETANLTASVTRNFEVATGLNAQTAISTSVVEGMPALVLHAGQTFRVYDANAVSAEADDMIVHVRGVQHQ